MKPTDILLRNYKFNFDELPRVLFTGSIFNMILVILMLSWVTLIPSCVVAVRTPRYDTNGVIIECNVHRGGHFYGEQHYSSNRHDHYHGKK